MVTALSADERRASGEVAATTSSSACRRGCAQSAEVAYHVGTTGTVVVLALAFSSRGASGCWLIVASPRVLGWLGGGRPARGRRRRVERARPPGSSSTVPRPSTRSSCSPSRRRCSSSPRRISSARRDARCRRCSRSARSGALVRSRRDFAEDVVASCRARVGRCRRVPPRRGDPGRDTSLRQVSRRSSSSASLSGPRRSRRTTGVGRDALRCGRARRRRGLDRRDRTRRDRRAPVRQGLAHDLVQGLGREPDADPQPAAGAARVPAAARRTGRCAGAARS